LAVRSQDHIQKETASLADVFRASGHFQPDIVLMQVLDGAP
jgi:hypothetical protein